MKTFFKKLFVTGFFSGYSPVMPGTMGTIVGVFIYLLLYQYNYILYPLIIVLFIYGVKLSDWAEKYFKEKDSKKIVIDEIVGYLISMANIKIVFNIHNSKTWWVVFGGFILFRFFDIVKPFYINQLQNIKGGLGVMMDDVLAGVYTNLVLLLIIECI